MKQLDLRGYWVTTVDTAQHPPWDARSFFRDFVHPKYNLVFHCAAVVGGREKIEGAPLDLAVNLELDASFFTWCMKVRPERIVYFSSSAAYPVHLQTEKNAPHFLSEVDIDLEDIRQPDMSYGLAKLVGEKLAEWAKAEGLIVNVFRPFSGYGEDQSLDYPFPTFIARALAGQDPFHVWGSGRQVRDWIHVDDMMGAIFAAIDLDYQETLNLCSGQGVSFDQLAIMCTRAAGYTPDIFHLLDKPMGVFYRVGHTMRMKEVYSPTWTVQERIKKIIAERLA